MDVTSKAQETKAKLKKQDDIKGLNCLPHRTFNTHLHRSEDDGYQMTSWGVGKNWEQGINIYIDTIIYKIDNQKGPTTKPQATLLEIL